MKRTYVPFCHVEKYNAQIFYDYELREFFYSSQKKNSGVFASSSGLVGILLYAYLKDVSFDIGLSRFVVVLLTMGLGAVLSFINIQLSMLVIKKGVKKRKKIVNPTKGEMEEYIIKGRRESKQTFKTVSLLFLFSVMGSGMLLVIPNSLLFFFLNIAIWAAFLYAIWGVRLIKTLQTYKQLESEL